MLLALHCFSRSPYRTIGIDTALEQLDAENRASALAYLGSGRDPFDVVLIDNRLEPVPPDWTRQDTVAAVTEFACDLAGVAADLAPREAPTIAISGMEFSYPSGQAIFRDLDLTLAPGTAYRLIGRNGAGKTTALKSILGLTGYQGSLRVLGRDPASERDALMRKIYLYGVSLVAALILLFQLAQVIYRLLLLLMGDASAPLLSVWQTLQLVM